MSPSRSRAAGSPVRFPLPIGPATLLVAGLLLTSLPAASQQSSTRNLRGQVLDEMGKAVATAIVYLKNISSKEVLTVVTNKQGRYLFTDLDMKDDYELYAERGNQKSPTKKVSQFDTREEIVWNLRLEPEKKADAQEEKNGDRKDDKEEKD